MILLQTQVSGSFDAIAIAMWAIGGMLGLIAVLIGVIWQDNKANGEKKHQDLVTLIDKLDSRQDKLDEKQQEQAFQLIALDTTVKLLQGQPIDLQNIHYKPMPKP